MALSDSEQCFDGVTRKKILNQKFNPIAISIPTNWKGAKYLTLHFHNMENFPLVRLSLCDVAILLIRSVKVFHLWQKSQNLIQFNVIWFESQNFYRNTVDAISFSLDMNEIPKKKITLYPWIELRFVNGIVHSLLHQSFRKNTQKMPFTITSQQRL